MRESYNELLEKPEWKQKREEILERDNHTCQRCGMDEKLKLKNDGQLFFKHSDIEVQFVDHLPQDPRNILLKLSPEHTGLLVKSHLPVELLANKPLLLIIHTVRKDFNSYPFKATLGKIHFSEKVHNQLKDDLLIEKTRHQLMKENLDIDLEGIYLMGIKEPFIKFTDKDNHYFHVHHICYRKGVDIWEQPNQEYITLCNVCHQIVHESQDIPFYDEAGNDLKKQFPHCAKCNGRGYLPEFSYYLGGTCFNCQGMGCVI